MNRTIGIALLAGLLAGFGCSSKPAPGTNGQYMARIKTEAAISQARGILARQNKSGTYDPDSGQAYDKGSYWKVCFKPRKDKWALFDYCVEIEKK